MFVVRCSCQCLNGNLCSFVVSLNSVSYCMLSKVLTFVPID